MKLNRWIRQSTVVLLAGFVAEAALATAACEAAPLGDVERPIKLSMQEWSAQNVSTYIVGELLKKMGYKVDFVTIGTVPSFQALIDGDIGFSVETWLQTDYQIVKDGLRDGKLLDLGDSGIDPIQTWFYTPYTEEQCKGLPDWKALKSCADVFSTPETLGKGRLLDYPADWPTNNDQRIKALDLPYETVHAGSEGAMVAEIKSAFERHQSLLVQFWTPHWIFQKYPLKQLTLPPYEEGCFEKPEIGINPNATFDCDWNKLRVLKTAWPGLKTTWPAAYRLLQSYSVNNEDEAGMMLSVDVDGTTPQDAAKAWLDKNHDRWQPWITDAAASQ